MGMLKIAQALEPDRAVSVGHAHGRSFQTGASLSEITIKPPYEFDGKVDRFAVHMNSWYSNRNTTPGLLTRGSHTRRIEVKESCNLRSPKVGESWNTFHSCTALIGRFCRVVLSCRVCTSIHAKNETTACFSLFLAQYSKCW